MVANALLEQPLAARLPIHIALFAVGAALFARAWTMSRLWDETLVRERLARAELEQTNRELEAFSYAASHDLKAPLVSIQGFAASLRRRSEEELDARSLLYLNRIESNAVGLQELIDELLEFARRGRDGAQGPPIDADAIARDVVRAFRERHAGRGANVELVAPLPPVRAHPTRFRQALTNLVENALEHAGADAPHVQITGFADDGTVSIVVQDDGHGVADADAGRIFDLFARGDRGGAAGSGIGLALVKKVAESSGGSIRYEPGPRGGSRFVLSLPKGLDA
jgi:signal transduction histidine kinase